MLYPIDGACRLGWSLDVIETMLEAGASRQLLPVEGDEGPLSTSREFPFLTAASYGNPVLLRLLLEKGGDEQLNLTRGDVSLNESLLVRETE